MGDGSALRLENLSKRYGSVQAVQDVTLAVPRGSIYGLLGPNGSGKTTTLGCALGLLAPDGGRAEVLGVPSARLHEVPGRVGVVLDRATLLPGLSARQNLEYARRLGAGRPGGRGLDEALALVGMSALADRRVGRMSLGQTRRVAIARALIGTPDLVVLDEPLSGLDTLGVVAMLALFRRLAADGLTLLASSHQLHEMEQIVSHVAILVSGRIVADGPLVRVLGGHEPRLRVRASPAAAAEAALLRLQPPPRLEREGEDLLVTPGPVPASAVAAAVVGAGCALSALVPERRSLQAVFESLTAAAPEARRP